MTKTQKLEQRIETQERLLHEIRMNEAKVIGEMNELTNINGELSREVQWCRSVIDRILDLR